MTIAISVIIAAYNAQDTIARAVQSLLDQTQPVAEILVVDDVSTDGTRAVVQRMADADPRIKLLENAVNQGPSGSRNLGMRAATGEWVAVLDADDAWTLDRTEIISAAIDRFEADIVLDNQLLYDAAADEVTREGFSRDRGVRWIAAADVFEQDVQLGAEFSYGILKPVIRKRFLDTHNLRYNQTVRYGEDLLFLAELVISGARAVLIPEPLYIYTTRFGEHSGQASPHSRSIPRFDLFAEAIEALRLKHRETLGPDVARAMSRLARRFSLVHQSNLAKEQRLSRGLLAYALYVGRRPAVLAQVLRQRAAYLGRMLQARQGAKRA